MSLGTEMIFIVEEDQTVDALGLQDYSVLFQIIRPEFIDNAFAINCVIDIFYYLYLEDVPAIDTNAASFFVARKAYLDWAMQTEELERLKVKTVNKKDKSLLVAVHIVNAISDVYLTVIKQYSNEDIQLINRFLGHKVTIFSADFLQDTNYPSRLEKLETEICKKVVQTLEQDRVSIMKEIQEFFNELLRIEKELFDNFEVPFTIRSFK